jgi:hypothetical protein
MWELSLTPSSSDIGKDILIQTGNYGMVMNRDSGPAFSITANTFISYYDNFPADDNYIVAYSHSP